MTNYPEAIDTPISLPTVIDLFTPVAAVTINRLRDAIIAIESILGVQPNGIYTTVGGRITNIENIVSNLNVVSLGGDIGGTRTSPLVIGIQGNPVSSATPAVNNVLIWNGVAWIPGSFTSTLTAGGDLSGLYPNPTVVKIQTNPVMAGTPTVGSVYVWNGSKFVPQPIADISVSSSAAIQGTKISPNFGGQNIFTTGNLTTQNAIINGNLTVLGTTTTIDSTVVDVEARIIHGNFAAISGLGVPVQIVGFEVQRGDTGGVYRDAAAMLWIEGSSYWQFAFQTQANDTAVGPDVAIRALGATLSGLGGGGAGYVAVSNSGLLSFTNTILYSSITPGTSGQIFVSNASPASVWTSLINYSPTTGFLTSGGTGSNYSAAFGPVPGEETVEAALYLLPNGVSPSATNMAVLGNGNTYLNSNSTLLSFSWLNFAETAAWMEEGSGTFLLWNLPNFSWVYSGGAPVLSQSAPITDVATNPFTISPQGPYASASTHVTPGNLVVNWPAPISGVLAGKMSFQTNGSEVAYIQIYDNGVSTFVGSTNTSLNSYNGFASVNLVEGGNNTYTVYDSGSHVFADHANYTDATLSNTGLVLGPGSAAGTLIQSSTTNTSFTVGTNKASATLNLQVGAAFTGVSINNAVSTNTTMTFNSPLLATAAQISVNDNGAVFIQAGAANYILFNTVSGNTYVTYNAENHYFTDNTSHPYLTLAQTDTYFGGTTGASPLYVDWSTATTPAIIAGTASTSLRIGTNNGGSVTQLMGDAFVNILTLNGVAADLIGGAYLGLNGTSGTYPTLGAIRSTDHAGTGFNILGIEYSGITYTAISQSANTLIIGADPAGNHSVAANICLWRQLR